MKLSLRLKTRTLNVLIGCLMVAALLGACGGGDNTNSTANTGTNTARNTNAAATNTNAAATPAGNTSAVPSADKIGVAECDEYIAKYEACISSKVPANLRATYQTAFDTARKAWRDAAATPQGKASLAATCKAAHDTAKTSLASFGCSW